MTRTKSTFLALLAVLLSPLTWADAILTSDRATFEAMGTIDYNYGFEDFPTNAFSDPGNPWYSNGITYTTDSNLIVGAGPGTAYNVLSNVMTYNFWSPLTGDIDAGFNMFGFDLSVGNSEGGTAPLDITIFTTMGSYSWLGQAVPNASRGSQFYGFTLTGGETFLGFQIDSPGSPYFPAFDNATLGQAVPEPGTLALLSLGLLGLGLSRRKKV